MICDKHSMAFIRGQSPRYLSELQIKLLYIILNATGESKLLKSRKMSQVINLMEFRKCIKWDVGNLISYNEKWHKTYRSQLTTSPINNEKIPDISYLETCSD